MGLFEKIFGKASAPQGYGAPYQLLTGYCPVWTSWGGKLYENELVRSAIGVRATHISKLRVDIQGTAQPRLKSALLRGPNDWQTWGQFLYRVSTILDMQNTVFVVPLLDEFDRICGIFPVLPDLCEIVDFEGEPWLRYHFSNGKVGSIEMWRCGIMTKYQYEDDFFGASNRALTPTMDLIHIQNQGITEGVKNSVTYRFWAKLNNLTKAEDLTKERQRFTRENLEGDNRGLLLFPSTYSEINQVNAKPFVIDADQMAAIRQNVNTYFGVNDDILQNKAYGDKWSAFYEGVVEWFAIQFSDVLSQMLFTPAERARGARIVLTANQLQYMSNEDKYKISTGMADRGIMNRDEIRAMWNLPPLPDGQGQVYTIRGEYYLLAQNGDVIRKEDDLTSGAK